jgi:hypothetical protein
LRLIAQPSLKYIGQLVTGDKIELSRQRAENEAITRHIGFHSASPSENTIVQKGLILTESGTAAGSKKERAPEAPVPGFTVPRKTRWSHSLAISYATAISDGDDDDDVRHRYRSKLVLDSILVLDSKQELALGSILELALGSIPELVLELGSKLVLELGSILARSSLDCGHDDDDLLRLLVRTSQPVPELRLHVLHSSSCFSSKETELESQCSNIENSSPT